MLQQFIAAWVENFVVKVCHTDAHVPENCSTAEHQNKQQVGKAARIEVDHVDLDWEHKGKLLIAWWAQENIRHWLRYQNRKAWQVKYITLPWIRRCKRHRFAVVEAISIWLESYPVTNATTQNTLSFEK